MDKFEDSRQRFKPNKVNVLFVGESRPCNGTFFYHENSNLYRYTRAAFEESLGIKFDCQKFQELGCWLYDVCLQPVNGLTDKERRQLIIDGVPALQRLISELKPKHIIVVKKGDMAKYVCPAIKDCGDVYNLPFPSCGQQANYKNELKLILPKLFTK